LIFRDFVVVRRLRLTRRQRRRKSDALPAVVEALRVILPRAIG
jgi:hypothetical protein